MVLISDESADLLRSAEYLTDTPVTILPDGGAVSDQYGVSAIPRTILLTRDGEAANFEGYSEDHMRALREKVREVVSVQ